MRARRPATVIALSTASLLAGATLLAGCGAGSEPSSQRRVGEPRAWRARERRRQRAGQASLGRRQRAVCAGRRRHRLRHPDTAPRVVPITRSVVYRGDITVRVKDVEAAVDRAEGFATGVDGLVFGEETSTRPGPQGSLRGDADPPGAADTVPPGAQPARRARQAAVSQSQTAEDVTSQAIDVASRLRPQQASVARLRALLAQATTIGEVVQVEGELSQREADLESLEAQQKALDDLVDLATINGHPRRAGRTRRAAGRGRTNLGFLAGLRGGWDALAGGRRWSR